MCSTGPIPGSSSHLQCYITCGIPKWKGGWHGRSDHVHNIRLTEDGQVGLLCTLTPHENKISSKVNGESLYGDRHTEQYLHGTNSDTINISNVVQIVVHPAIMLKNSTFASILAS